MSLQNDDDQDFDVRWDHCTINSKRNPFRRNPGRVGLYKSNLQNSFQLQTVMALYDQEVARNNGEPDYQQLQTVVNHHVRNRNFRVRNDVVERGSVTKSQKGNKAYVERKVGECFQWKAHGQCSTGDPCSFCHDLLASGNKGVGQRRKGRSSCPASHSKAKQTDGEEQKSSHGSGNKQENSKDKSEIPCRFKFFKNPSRRFWHPPMCPNYKTEKSCVYCDKCRFRHVEAERKPNKKWKTGGAQGSVAMLKESIQVGCVSQDSYPRKSFLRKRGVHREEFSKSANLMSAVLARQNSRKDHMRRP